MSYLFYNLRLDFIQHNNIDNLKTFLTAKITFIIYYKLFIKFIDNEKLYKMGYVLMYHVKMYNDSKKKINQIK